MRRLSKPIKEMKQHYDVVVIGSGYGGGVAASRLSRCGKSVCVLERGKEFELGDFPDTLLEAQQQFQVTTSEGKHAGSPLALYDMRMGKDIHVLIGCGLGGTSLINANVSLQPDPRIWLDPIWPDNIATDNALAAGYARARRMLRPTPYPNKIKLAKLEAMGKAADALGHKCTRPPLNVTFEKETNLAGVEQPACTLCGDCCSGCNVGAKNTTQVTYIADAYQHDADIFTQARVSHVKREGNKWRVYFELLGHGREKFGTAEQSIVAEIVVLGAGTLGSTEILLRSKEAGLPVSDVIGKRFTGNGDVLAFGYNNDVVINSIGVGHPPRVHTDPVGPCISGLIDLRNSRSMTDGFVIEEGVIPSGLASILPEIMVRGSVVFGKDTDLTFKDQTEEFGRGLQSLLHGAYKGAVNRSQTFLVMSHDNAGGIMRLESGRFFVDWPGVADQPIFQAVNDKLEAVTAVTGGTHIKNPMSRTFLGKNLITVHPLGGCNIGRNLTEGVVNHKCQVFDPLGRDEDSVHEGLYVCDGAVVPRSLGVNPLLTITALAERAMIHLAKDYNLGYDDAPVTKRAKLYAAPTPGINDQPAGVEFTERMAGFISTTSMNDYESGEKAGRGAGSRCSFTVTVLVDDVDKFIADNEHTGAMVGTVDCPALSPDPLQISNGIFNLMHIDHEAVGTRRFDYRMTLTASDGQEYYFRGHKVVRADPGPDLWYDTTTLFVEISKGRMGREGLAARGILKIAPSDFAVQLQTLQGVNGRSHADRLRATALFGGLFAATLYDTYGLLTAPLKRHDNHRLRKRRDLRVGPPEVHHFMTDDHKALLLTRYDGGGKGPVIFAHGLGVSGKIFSIDTIETNLLEFLYAAGYDCWLLEMRASIDLPTCHEQFTADDIARYDYPAAVAKVREVTGRSSVQVVAHCFGATTFVMAKLAGLKGVRSAVISQIATDVFIPWWPQRLLAHLRMPSLLAAAGFETVNARAEKSDGFAMRLVDGLLRWFLILQGHKRTRNATSNRITALYGPLYNFKQLNKATVDNGLPEMFGVANITAFKQLALIGRRKRILTHDGKDDYLPNIKRLSIPICFIHGARNACFRPKSTLRALQRVIAANGADQYERHVIPDHGHLDCIFGKDAVRTVFPLILRHLEKTARTDAQIPRLRTTSATAAAEPEVAAATQQSASHAAPVAPPNNGTGLNTGSGETSNSSPSERKGLGPPPSIRH